MEGFPIDAVITWVDGNDPAHRAKRKAFLTDKAEDRSDDIGGATRFSSSGEIFFCIGSILRFAPFVRKIFIVTDCQDPHTDDFIHRNFPDTGTGVEVVDHRVIFRGYEQYLPTFNSLSIETMLYRIPGLSEHFVYFNDDMFLMRGISRDDWFEGGKTVLLADRFSVTAARLLRAVKLPKGGHRPFGYKDAMLNAARILGSSCFWLFPHGPVALSRSWYERFYSGNADVLENNIRHRFRDASQYNPQSLYTIDAVRSGQCVVRSPRGKALFIKEESGKANYMERKLREADSGRDLAYGCINSMDKAPENDRAMFVEWICNRLKIKIL